MTFFSVVTATLNLTHFTSRSNPMTLDVINVVLAGGLIGSKYKTGFSDIFFSKFY